MAHAVDRFTLPTSVITQSFAAESLAEPASIVVSADDHSPDNSVRRQLSARKRDQDSPSERQPTLSSSTGRMPNNSSSHNAVLNPEATDFMPVTRMSGKRKASSSIKSERSTSSDFDVPAAANGPIIRWGDLFGIKQVGPTTTSMLDGATDDLENDDDLAVVMRALYAPGSLPPSRSSRIAAFDIIRELTSIKQRGLELSHLLPKLSVMLISRHGSAQQRTDLRYLPLCLTLATGASGAENEYAILPQHLERIQRISDSCSRSQVSWPACQLPVEIFELVTKCLARDDVKSMRLVNHEFEQKVSRCLFYTSVVPFNPELFDMISEDTMTSMKRALSGKGRGKSRVKASRPGLREPRSMTLDKLHWQNTREDQEGKMYNGNGLRVFQGFGPYIKRFGMSFEVSEAQLHHAPPKRELDQVEAYHGLYSWPPSQYTRFTSLAGLERTADETPRMKAAFANLKIVQELALSLDSGLGWLVGPDRSIHAQVFHRPSRIFGTSHKALDHSAQAAEEFWAALQQSQATFDHNFNPKEVTLGYRELDGVLDDLNGLRGTPYSNPKTWSSVDISRVAPDKVHMLSGTGVIYTTSNPEPLRCSEAGVTPNDLKKEQKEWLLETEWAQRAFLESYVLAVMDNAHVFANVTTFNMAKLSSCFLGMISRKELWQALPCLEHVILHVSPDWRSVAKDDAGMAETTSQDPSRAVHLFHNILKHRISFIKTVKRLSIGWVGGGERGEGMFARNKNVLPAPTAELEHSTANSSVLGLTFEFVEHLTLTNCWVTPPMLTGLVRNHANAALRKLTLDSVSLTAHPRFPPGAFAAHQAAQLQAHAPLPPPPPPALHNTTGNAQAQQLPQMGPWLTPAQQQALSAHLSLPAPNAVNAHDATMQPHWTDGHREGSWPDVLNNLSPGPVFADYLPKPQPRKEARPTRPTTALQTLEFISCGYAKLASNLTFDQQVFDRDIILCGRGTSEWFRLRTCALRPHMMARDDVYLGDIVQRMPQRELNALRFAWGCREGWEDASEAEEAEYDGRLPGGTGRFSGVVGRDMALVRRPLPCG